MKQTLSTTEAALLLVADENAAWTHAGALALVEYLESVEADTGEEMEFDRVAIRCEWAEFSSALAAASEYDFESDEGQDGDEKEQEAAALEWLQDRTDVIEFNGGVIIRQF